MTSSRPFLFFQQAAGIRRALQVSRSDGLGVQLPVYGTPKWELWATFEMPLRRALGVIVKCAVGASVTRILKIGFQARTFFEC